MSYRRRTATLPPHANVLLNLSNRSAEAVIFSQSNDSREDRSAKYADSLDARSSRLLMWLSVKRRKLCTGLNMRNDKVFLSLGLVIRCDTFHS
jgi:hypothetical protein